MNEASHIQFTPHEMIDKKKWDTCIEKAENGLIYAYSFYLDAMADTWDALVLHDYEAVMPLPWKKKYGISYLYQPSFTAQLGIFGNAVQVELVEAFLNAVPKKFKYWDISLNAGNLFETREFKIYARNNFILDLNKPFEDLYRSFNENTKRNIRKAEQVGCRVQKDIHVDQVIELALSQMKDEIKQAGKQAGHFKRLYHYLHERQKAVTYAVFSNEKLLASSVYFFSHGRAYYILAGNHPEAKSTGASHYLINAFIKDHAGQNLLLDFEGSDIPGLAFFYSGFGAAEEKYAALKLNRLPYYLRWMKR
jgi:hypothetical protein